MLAQTDVNKGSRAVLRARRGTGGEGFAEVYTIAAVVQEGYRCTDMASVVARQAVVVKFVVDRFSANPLRNRISTSTSLKIGSV
jgi:hypothetical protein